MPAENSAPDPLTPIPLVILSGFLGAGKTTRLNEWLKHPDFADTLVIINEFGAIGLDHLLVEEATGDVVLLAAGCLCCTVRGDLVATLEDLLRRRDNQRIRFFRRILIETTGLADPLPILQSVLQHPYLSKRFVMAGLVTLVDAVHGAATLDAHPEARRQVVMADTLLITKADLAEAPAIAALHARLTELNPIAAGQLDNRDIAPGSLFEHRFLPNGDARLLAWLGDPGLAATLQHAGADDEPLSQSFTSGTPISAGALVVFQEAMRLLHGPRLLRLKGLIALDDDVERPVVIHHVQSLAHPPVRLAGWPSRDRRTRLVFITRGIAPGTIEKFWQALGGTDKV